MNNFTNFSNFSEHADTSVYGYLLLATRRLASLRLMFLFSTFLLVGLDSKVLDNGS